jgi:hypothetical protein
MILSIDDVATRQHSNSGAGPPIMRQGSRPELLSSTSDTPEGITSDVRNRAEWGVWALKRCTVRSEYAATQIEFGGPVSFIHRYHRRFNLRPAQCGRAHSLTAHTASHSLDVSKKDAPSFSWIPTLRVTTAYNRAPSLLQRSTSQSSP